MKLTFPLEGRVVAQRPGGALDACGVYPDDARARGPRVAGLSVAYGR